MYKRSGFIKSIRPYVDKGDGRRYFACPTRRYGEKGDFGLRKRPIVHLSEKRTGRRGILVMSATPAQGERRPITADPGMWGVWEMTYSDIGYASFSPQFASGHVAVCPRNPPPHIISETQGRRLAKHRHDPERKLTGAGGI